MPTSEELKAAVSEGIIDAGQAERLTSFFATRAAANPWDSADGSGVETEEVRFVRGFHDILVSIGVALLFVGLAVVSVTTGLMTMGFALSAAIAWGLAEYLGRIKRLVLPTIVLAIAFIFFSGWAIVPFFSSGIVRFTDLANGSASILVWGPALAGALAFYLRFRLPFALGLIAGAATMLVFLFIGNIAPRFAIEHKTTIFLVFGIAIFAAAMSFDLSDPERKTLRADNAFWLHLLAAPLIVHTVLSMVALGKGKPMDLADAGLIIAVVIALCLVALLVDRRALLVVGLGYLGAAIAVVVRETTLEDSSVIAVTLIILGVGVVTLGIGWQSTRSVLLMALPLPSGLVNRLPPIAGKS